MKKPLFVAAVVCTITCLAVAQSRRAAPPERHTAAVTEDAIAVYFSPKGGCTEAVVTELAAAKKTIDFQAYSFTSTDIARALAEAHDRGVKVRAVLDRKETGSQYSGGSYLFNHQVPVWTDGEHPIAHNKVIVIDGATVITGSFNFTKQAENSNAENMLVIHNHPKLVAAYGENFAKHLGHSEKYEGVKEPR